MCGMWTFAAVERPIHQFNVSRHSRSHERHLFWGIGLPLVYACHLVGPKFRGQFETMPLLGALNCHTFDEISSLGALFWIVSYRGD